jgi:hypothetical protein
MVKRFGWIRGDQNRSQFNVAAMRVLPAVQLDRATDELL